MTILQKPSGSTVRNPVSSQNYAILLQYSTYAHLCWLLYIPIMCIGVL